MNSIHNPAEKAGRQPAFRGVRSVLFGSVAVLALAGAQSALAQETGAAPPPAGDAATVSEVVVTGTAIRGVAPVGSATVTMNRQDIEAAPVRDPSSLITMLPQGSGLGSTLANNAGRNAGVNLRGLGNNATLLLFDGHRTVAQGVTNQIADPNTIPFAAIERVEVVTDGASAIYGSDAVAGVVNYILRRPFDGGEVSARYINSLYHEYNVEGVFGHTWSGGGFLAGLSYETNNEVRRSASPFLAQDLRPFGGNDNRFIGTTVTPDQSGALIVGTTVYGLPANLNGRVPTAAEVQALKNNPSLIDTSQFQDYYTKRKRLSGIFRAQQDFGRFGQVMGTVLFNNRTNDAPGTGDGGFTNIGIPIAPNSPYYIQGLGGGRETVVYNFRANNPGRELDQHNVENTVNLILDYKVHLFRDFQFTGSAVYGNEYGCAVCQPQGNTTLAAVITSPPYAGAFNPFQQGPQPTAEGLFGGFIQKASNQLTDVTGKIDGSLWELPGGAVRIAVGGEAQAINFRMHALNTLDLTTTYQTSRFALDYRSIWSGYAEAFVPIFGPNNERPGLKRLDLSLAVRYDDYSDAGSTTNPKFGLNWSPTDDLLVRASWGTSFRAPTLGESDPRTIGQTNRIFVSNGLGDPNIPVTLPATGQTLVLSRGGNSGDLKPETARTWSVGADYKPHFIPGLKLSATYYSVDYKNLIQNLPNSTLILSNPATYALYKNFFIVAPQPKTCVNGNPPGLPGTAQYATYNPAYLPWLNDPNAVYSPSTANDCQLVGIIAGGLRNLGRVVQNGLDLNGTYNTPTPLGDLSINAGFTKILKLQRALLPDTPLFSALDTIGNQVSARGRASAMLTRGPFRGMLAVNYTGKYLNDATITVNGKKLPDTEVPAWTTFDAGLYWTAPETASAALQGVRVGVTVQNFTDKDPPIVLSGTNAVDLNNANIWGRVWTFEVNKKF